MAASSARGNPKTIRGLVEDHERGTVPTTLEQIITAMSQKTDAKIIKLDILRWDKWRTEGKRSLLQIATKIVEGHVACV